MAVDPDGRVFEGELSKRERQLAKALGEDTLGKFRDEYCSIYCERVDHSDATQYDLRRWVKVGRRGIEDSRKKWASFDITLSLLGMVETLFSFVLCAVIALVAQFFGLATVPSLVVGTLVTIVLTMLNTGLIFTKALVNQISYPPTKIHTRLDNEVLYFRAAWNKSIVGSNVTLIGLLVLGLVADPDSRGYEIGTRIVEWYADMKAP